MKIIATFIPQHGERELVESLLDVDWLVDGANPAVAETALVFWPREELRSKGKTWFDFHNLQWIQVATAGVNHIGWSDLPRVPVSAVPGSNAAQVSEWVVATIFEWARGLREHTEAIRAGEWRLGAMVRSVRGLKVGLVGYGGIGKAVEAHLHHFGAETRHVRSATVGELPEMAAWADVLVCGLPLTRETVGLVDEAVLAALGEGLLVNVARGPVVVEEDLFNWLQKPGTSAALDVWWKYPKNAGERPFNLPFHELGNVVMTPHHAPNVPGFRLDVIRAACEQILHYQKTGERKNLMDREAHLVDVEGDGR